MPNTINLIDFCIFHHDGGHGWLETTKEVIDFLNISEKISTCSYMKGDRVFLEEDCDFSLFVKAIEPKLTSKIEWGWFVDRIEHPSDCETCKMDSDSISAIRDFAPYRRKN